jgi:hypothetical protein
VVSTTLYTLLIQWPGHVHDTAVVLSPVIDLFVHCSLLQEGEARMVRGTPYYMLVRCPPLRQRTAFILSSPHPERHLILTLVSPMFSRG